MTPIDPIVEALVCRLDESLREAFEERAGVMQFEAGRERELAEALALLEVVRSNPLAGSQLSVIQAVLVGERVTVLARDHATGTARLAALGATSVSAGDLSMALSSLGGTARLTALPSSAEK